MAKLKLVDMSVSPDTIKSTKGQEVSLEPSTTQKEKVKRTKLHNRVGKGNFKAHVIMSNLTNDFVKVKRAEVDKHLVKGWKTVKRQEYKAAINKGVAAAAVPEVKAKKNRKAKKK